VSTIIRRFNNKKPLGGGRATGRPKKWLEGHYKLSLTM
jgi:hypothetical protein